MRYFFLLFLCQVGFCASARGQGVVRALVSDYFTHSYYVRPCQEVLVVCNKSKAAADGNAVPWKMKDHTPSRMPTHWTTLNYTGLILNFTYYLQEFSQKSFVCGTSTVGGQAILTVHYPYYEHWKEVNNEVTCNESRVVLSEKARKILGFSSIDPTVRYRTAGSRNRSNTETKLLATTSTYAVIKDELHEGSSSKLWLYITISLVGILIVVALLAFLYWRLRSRKSEEVLSDHIAPADNDNVANVNDPSNTYCEMRTAGNLEEISPYCTIDEIDVIKREIEDSRRSELSIHNSAYSVPRGMNSRTEFEHSGYSVPRGVNSRKEFKLSGYSVPRGVNSRKEFEPSGYSVPRGVNSRKEFKPSGYSVPRKEEPYVESTCGEYNTLRRSSSPTTPPLTPQELSDPTYNHIKSTKIE